jgi:DNA-binding MurR/RpiR family transcriptional regulator
LSQNPVGFGQALRKPGQIGLKVRPGFSVKSKETVPKLKFWKQPQIFTRTSKKASSVNKSDIKDASQSCLLRLQEILPELKPVEYKVADYILKNPQDVMSSTILGLSGKTGASYATINRLIVRLGYSGFKEFKKFLYEDSIRHSMIQFWPGSLDFLNVISHSHNASSEEICRNMYDLSSKILEESRNIISIEALNNAAQNILSSNNISFIGTGLSGISARYAYSQFFRIGIHCCYESDSTLYRIKTSLLNKNDMIFAISSTGRSSNILECVKIAKENQVKIISLTDYAISPLSKLAHINLFTTPRNSSKFMNVDMPLIIGQIFIIDTLYMICCAKMGKKSIDFYGKTKGIADSEKIQK